MASKFTIDDMNDVTGRFMTERFMEQLQYELAIRRGEFFCIKCRQPFQLYGPFIDCGCLPAAFRSPFIYAKTNATKSH
jgi:hypothetical protein